MFSCSCCGSDVTSPKFYKGAVYGYSCFARITGEKVRKDKAVWVQAERIELAQDDCGWFYAVYLFAGKRIRVAGPLMSAASMEAKGETIETWLPADALQVTNAKGMPLYKGMVIGHKERLVSFNGQIVPF